MCCGPGCSPIHVKCTFASHTIHNIMQKGKVLGYSFSLLPQGKGQWSSGGTLGFYAKRLSVPRTTWLTRGCHGALHVLAMPRHCTRLVHGLSAACGWPGCPHIARVLRRCRCWQTGRRSSCAHVHVFRKPGMTMFSRLFYDLLPSGEWWDTILADSDRWGARKFTIRPSTAPGRGLSLSLSLSLDLVKVKG